MTALYFLIITKMKKTLSTLIALLIIAQISFAQNGQRKDNPILKEVSGLEVIKTVFNDAESVQKDGSVWFKIIDKSGKKIGYTLSSKPFTQDIIGYHNTTPIIVIMDNSKVIKKVALLSHYESTGYVNRLNRQGFFDNWNGLKPEQVLEKKAQLDSYTGATITAKAVEKNMEIIIKKALNKK